MWPFVLHRVRVELPADVYRVRGALASWLTRNEADWNGSVNREEATLRQGRRTLEGSELAALEVDVRYAPVPVARKARSRARDERDDEEHTRLDVAVSLAFHQLAIVLLVVAGFGLAAWRWSLGVRRGEVPFEWMAIATFGIMLAAVAILLTVATTGGRRTARELLTQWNAAVTAQR
jgi:hypothetical protein